MPENKYTAQIKAMEAAGQFDQDVRPVDPRFVKPIDPAKFKYCPKNPLWKIYAFFVRSVAFVFGPLVTWAAYDLRVKGKKNLRAIKGQGAIVISNHVSMLDALYLRQVSRTRSMYYLAAPFNNKKGLGGITIRAGGLLPMGESFQTIKQLDHTIADLLQKKKLLTVYAEHSLWLGYPKIRPFKKGAFYYAAKNHSPVVPVVALFRPVNWWDKLIGRKCKITLQILPVILPNADVDWHENITQLQDTCHQAMVDCANQFYGCESDATKLGAAPTCSA